MNIKTIIVTIATVGSIFTINAQTIKATFDWSNPTTLSPSYPSPTETKRSGEYVGNVKFTNNGVTMVVSDEEIKEKSQSARFYFGYNTGVCELRVYTNSDIIITAPTGMSITSIDFMGPEVGEYYLEPYCTGSWNGMIFTPDDENIHNEVKFYAPSRVEITNTVVTCSRVNAVTDIHDDVDDAQPVYYDLQGRPVDGNNITKGLYICKKGFKSGLHFIK